ncbi:MAG: enoyl-CoA hydratase/isomerase family protein [Myxococcota bacterium]|nr:enoyl-CoA hydratase/isomerase family protein [Myxococcota bacterium]
MIREDLGTKYLRFERDDHIATLTIDRPKARNALSSAMYFGIKRAVQVVNSYDDPVALIVTGTGDVFAPGGELRGQQDDAYPELDILTAADVIPFEAVRQSPAPIVSAVNGICQGGGLLVAMLSDVAVASERATFRAPEVLRGIADMGYAAYLPPQVGIAMARDMLVTGRRLDADEALACGLVSRKVKHDELMPEAIQAAENMLQGAPHARFEVKRVINAGYGLVDYMTFYDSLKTDECREGMLSFAEKRAPDWVPEKLKIGRM